MPDADLLRQAVRVSSLIGRLGLGSGSRALWSFYRRRLLPAGRPDPQPFPIPGGGSRTVWLRPGTADWHTYEQIFIRRDYDLQGLSQRDRVLIQYRKLLSTGRRPIIIDGGAHIGLATCWFKQVFPEATICSIEPDHGNFDLLKRNVAGVADVIAIRAGLWDRQATLSIRDAAAETWSFELQEDVADVANSTTAITVPEVLAHVSDGTCFIAKIDIEGGERQLFRSNTEWLDTVPLVIIELHDWKFSWGATAAPFFAAAARQKRDYVFRGENLFCFLHPDVGRS